MDQPDYRRWFVEHDPLLITRWIDPVVEKFGHDPRGTYCETYWLPIIGPASLWAVRRVAGWLERSPDGFQAPLSVFAKELGIGHKSGRQSPMVSTLCRLLFFKVGVMEGDGFSVRTMLAPLPLRYVRRLPAHLAAQHIAEVA